MEPTAESVIEANPTLALSSVMLSTLQPRRVPGPFPVYEISGALPSKLYQALYDGLPASTDGGWSAERNQAWLAESPVWQRFSELVCDRRFRVDAVRTLAGGFRDAHKEGLLVSEDLVSLLDAYEDPDAFAEAVADATSSSVLLLEMGRGERNTPHADGSKKLLTILLYFPLPGWDRERDGGDTLYHDVPPDLLRRGVYGDTANSRVPEESLAAFADATSIFYRGRYVANTWSIFVKTINSFHSVAEMTCPPGVRRLAVAVNFRLSARSREPAQPIKQEAPPRLAMLDERTSFHEPGFVRTLNLSWDGREIWLDAPSRGFVNRWRRTLSGVKERRTIPWLRRALTADGVDTFWDVGANVGVFSLVARHFRPDVSIASFEPEPNNFLSLCKTSVANGLDLMVYPIALSGESGVGVFNVHDRFITGLSLHQFGAGRLPPEQTAATIGIATFAADDLVYGQDLDAPDVIKIDVDGIEDKVVDGMARLIAERRIAFLAVETSGANHEKIDRRLRDAGYVHDLKPDGTAMWYYRRA